ncbi:MAG: MlaD family protein [Candidatus Brocadiales bacterium]
MEIDSLFVELVRSARAGRTREDYTARVEYAGITGLRYVEIEAVKEGKEPSRIELSFEPKYPVIPSRTSALEQLGDQLTNTLRNLNQLDVKAVSDKSTKLMDNLNTLLAQLDNAKIAGTIDNLEVTVKSLNELIADLKAKTLSGKLNVFLDEGILLSRNLNALTFELQDLTEADDAMGATADTVKELNQTLKQSPSTMLFSEPPQPRLIKGGKP